MDIRINRSMLAEGILPIFKVTKTKPVDLVSFHGTGFTIAPGLLATCWHCVNEPLKDNEQYAVIIVKEDGTDHKVLYLKNIEQDANGSDLATANHGWTPSLNLKLALNNAAFGQEVWTYGYPLSEMRLSLEGERQAYVPPRFLKGYVIRNLLHNHPQYGQVASYELDLPAPPGLSGAPLMLLGTTDVIGVIYGSNDIGTIDHFASVDPETGEKDPEVQRIITFSLAHYTETFLELTGKATDGLKLIDYFLSKTQGT